MKIEITYKIINLFKKRKWSIDSCHFSSDHILYLETWYFKRWSELNEMVGYNDEKLENYFIEYITHEIPELKKEEIIFNHLPF